MNEVRWIDTPVALRLISLAGLFVMLALAWLLSENRRKVPWRIVLWGLALQLIFGLLVLRTAFGRTFFDHVRAAFGILTDATKEGAGFVFGNLPVNYDIGAIIAFQVLPVIIFVSSLAAILHHLRITQFVVRTLAYAMRRTMKTSGAETFGASLLVFLGIESLTAIRVYLRDMTRSELCTLMTTFMATIAASVMVAYASFGAEPGHLLAASLMSAPAAILISKIMVPEQDKPKTSGDAPITVPVESHNVVDAAARGASDGLMLALNVGAMLIAFIGLIYLIDLAVARVTGSTFPEIMGWVFRPFAFLMGVPRADIAEVAQLLGKKTVLNEFLAYADLKGFIDAGTLSPRGVTIATYALCGFANPGSLGILLGAMTGMIPERRAEVVNLGLRAFIGGTLACFTTACMAGLLLHG
ncbi:MAG: NupC/NupG family nucleoside CNT transporter [Nitrospiraceae bacterium]|nr:NupC/NupG family nucleoside CNT transporter [Nitrospiraceae bacterium]